MATHEKHMKSMPKKMPMTPPKKPMKGMMPDAAMGKSKMGKGLTKRKR